jgi:hypothetical protein
MQIIDTPRLEALSKAEAIQPPTVYGEDLQIASLVRRVRKLIKGAEAASDPIIWRACQLATMHHLDIFSSDVWLYPAYEGCKPDEWIVDVGISAWRRAAQRQARYNCVFTPLTADECRQRIGVDWTAEDIGFRCDLYRLDVARECKDLGIPYTPTAAYGFWRKQARWSDKQNKWIADRLANTETREDKAQKRAEKKALKVAFILDYPEERLLSDPDQGQWRVAESMEQSTSMEERIRAMPANAEPKTKVEPNGDQLWA